MDRILSTHYKAIRDEAVSRLLARDRLLVLYLAAVGTLFGIAFGKDGTKGIVVIVPFIAFGIALMLRDHELVLLRLGRWIRSEYEPYVQHYVKGELKQDTAVAVQKLRLPLWDTSPILKEYGETEIGPRYMGYALLLGLPSVIGVIWFAQSAGIGSPPLELSVAVLALVATFFTLYFVWASYRDRKASSARQVSEPSDGQN